MLENIQITFRDFLETIKDGSERVEISCRDNTGQTIFSAVQAHLVVNQSLFPIRLWCFYQKNFLNDYNDEIVSCVYLSLMQSTPK